MSVSASSLLQSLSLIAYLKHSLRFARAFLTWILNSVVQSLKISTESGIPIEIGDNKSNIKMGSRMSRHTLNSVENYS